MELKKLLKYKENILSIINIGKYNININNFNYNLNSIKILNNFRKN